ncbi:helix-turn-helix domain-containing protein [Campylobacter gastrosuis]|uniref:Helix-turn-helix domain-containing protein n=1 Tax=Campylobacter gastrosuis TaxID=2974576 RepID=A0ABT7HNJ1_9BACT|nr:helix-turn-helix domain-containing protein [Campylobacter gastrosuis]MDL0088497.1 helix-turn-helix domain-containing protein [Campylobacter gastrosuis]
MENLEAVLARIRAILCVKTDKQMCKILEIPYNTLTTWKDRKRIPKGKFLEIANKLNVSPTFLETGVNISNNTNRIIVNGSNNGSIVSSHQTQVDSELMEFIKLFKDYGNGKILKEFKDRLIKIKKAMECDK